MPTRATAPARVHLAGNPSDGYGGAVVSTVVPELGATVSVRPAERFSVSGPATSWSSLSHLARDASRYGHDGGDRLVTAALAALHQLLPPALDRPPLAIEWSTTIPRSVGLGGSSAIVVATMRAALTAWELEVPPHELAEAALVAETEHLGIAAGLADRVVQVTETTVLTDCRNAAPAVSEVAVTTRVPVTLTWSPDAAAPSDRYHADLRRRFAAGEPEVRTSMAELADLADAAARALATGDRDAFAEALDASLKVREALGAVPETALAPVRGLRAAGARVNFAGSGGALVLVGGTPPEGWSSHPLVLGA